MNNIFVTDVNNRAKIGKLPKLGKIWT